MNSERERLSVLPVRMPEDVYEQLRHLPGVEKRTEITNALFEGLSTLLVSHGVQIDWEKSGYRTKTVARIEDKIVRRNSMDPERDIYAVRFITKEERRVWLKDLIQSAYPQTPKVFSNGKLTSRDYRDENVRAQHIERSNPHMSPIYSALHINFVFKQEGSSVYDIGEVQIMTQKEFENYNDTYKVYPNGHSK